MVQTRDRDAARAIITAAGVSLCVCMCVCVCGCVCVCVYVWLVAREERRERGARPSQETLKSVWCVSGARVFMFV